MSIFRKCAEEIRVSITSNKNNTLSTRRPTDCWFHLPCFFLEWETFQIKLQTVKTWTLCSKTFFFESRAVYEIMLKNTVKLDRPSTTIRRTRIACWIAKDTNTFWISNTYCSSTGMVEARTRLNVTLYVHCMSVCLSVCLVNIKPVKQNTLLWKGEIPTHTTTIWDSGGKAPHIAGLGTRWTWVVSFIHRR